MAHISTVILWIMMIFMSIAALDRVFTQFGGAEQVLSKLGLGQVGRSISGSGEQFEEGFMAMGALGLAMVGMMAFAPVLSSVLKPFIVPLYEMLGASPAMFATTLIANDMGGFPLAMQLAGADTASGLYAGLLLGAMMGPTVVFIIPVAIGIIDIKDRRFLALGVLAGMITIPLGCIAGGMIAMLAGVTHNGVVVTFSMSMILMNLIPVVLISGLIGLGLKIMPEKMINGFQIFAKILIAFITIALAIAVIQEILGFKIIPGMDPIFTSATEDGGRIADGLKAVETIGYIACVLLGAYPMVFLLTRWFNKPLLGLGGLFKVNETSAAGMVASLANVIPMFGLFKNMDDRGKVLNVAFAVSAAFTFGDHLGFTAGTNTSMIFPMVVGKLVGGITAVFVAMMIAPKSTTK